MEQSEVRQLVSTAEISVSTAYFDAKDDGVRNLLLTILTNLNAILTQLNQDDLASRTADFNTVATLMSTSVLPGINKLNERVKQVVQVEGTVKMALSDAMKLSQTVSFFSIPSPF